MTENQTPSTPEHAQPDPTPVRAGSPRWLLPALLGAAGVIVVLLVVIVMILASGSDSDPEAGDDKPADETFTASGEITLTDSGVEDAGGECWGTGGYDDMSGGTQVVIRDADGTTVAAGALEPGSHPDSAYADVICVFPFTIENVPSGSPLYSVEVSHRGEVTFKEDEADELSFSLG